jgi:hypothetical protein
MRYLGLDLLAIAITPFAAMCGVLPPKGRPELSAFLLAPKSQYLHV